MILGLRVNLFKWRIFYCSMEFLNYPLGENVFNAVDVSKVQVNYALQYGKKALDSQKTFFEKNGILRDFPRRVVPAGAHGVEMLRIEDLSFSGYDANGTKCRGYDGVITTIPRVPLFAVVADCPQLMVAGKNTIGLLHASRSTVDQNIISKFFKLFSNFEDLKNVKVGFSPYIFQENFDHDYLKLKRKDDFAKHIDARDGKFYIDLAGVIKDDLVREGIKFDNIYDKRINTFEVSRISRELGGFQISYREHMKNPVKGGRGGLCVMLKK